MVIMNNLKNILSHKILILFAFIVICFSGTAVAEAKTISNNLRTISDTQLNMFKNIAERSSYKNYVIASEYISSSGYSSYTDYYLCLTNDTYTSMDTTNINIPCNEMYVYNNYSGTYSFTQVGDTNLEVIDSIYYTNTYISNSTGIYTSILIVLCTMLFLYIIFKIFDF